MLFNRIKRITPKTVTVSAATVLLNEKDHGNKQISLGVATAQTIVLPKATGKGELYSIYMPITATGSKIIRVSNTVDAFVGGSMALPSANGAVSYFTAVGGTSDTITLNGTTTGGIRGTVVEFVSTAPGIYRVTAFAVTSGTAATPFSATV